MKRPPPRRGTARTFETQPAAQAIFKALQHHGIAEEVRGQRVLTEWSELVGPKVAARTRPEGISDRVLWVEVVSSAWLHELNMLKAQLLKGLIERMGEPRVLDDVRFKLAGRSRLAPTNVPRARTQDPGPLPAGSPATGARREQIVNEVASVDDAELRELIARVRITNDR